MALICWSLSSSMFKYTLVDQSDMATCSATKYKADCPLAAPTTRARRRISGRMRSIVVGCDPSPVNLRELVKGQRRLDPRRNDLRGTLPSRRLPIPTRAKKETSHAGRAHPLPAALMTK
jgi:hypothetical protein